MIDLPPHTSAYKSSEDFAITMDAGDPLKKYRDHFFIPKINGADCVYLCGHSLGLQPRNTGTYIQQELKDWAELGVEAHFHAKHPWMPYHRLLREQTADLVGGKPDEVVVMNSLTVNLHLMMVSFYRPTPCRHKILVERGAFPSDQYAVKSQIQYHGFDPATSLVELGPLPGESWLRDEQIVTFIDRAGDEVALILFGGVNYATGQAFDLEGIVRAGHAKGCPVGFDLAHAAGNLPLKLNSWGPDFAVWCSYKYLNGGPGCIAGCFVHERHATADLPRFAGWWGHDQASRFQMGPDFRAMAGAEGWQLSNPPIVSLAALRASMDIFQQAGMENLRAKSMGLTGYLEFLLNEQPSTAFKIITPSEPTRRGAQLSIRVPHNGRVLCDRLAAEGFLCDWREPDILRVAPLPLYNSYRDVFRFVRRFKAALD